jgi:tetratricopeptide (TPR) repeat protein
VSERDYLIDLLNDLRESDPASVRQALTEAADAHPEDPRPLSLLAAELVHAKELDGAEAAYLTALQRAPDYAIARFQLGLLQLTSARPAAATATWGPLDALDETHPLRLFKRGLELLAQDRFEDARHWLLEGIRLNETNAPLNRDMQMVLDRIAQGLSGSGGQPADAPESTPRPEDHVLISAYRNVH